MNFLGGGERHSSADYRPRRTRTTFAGHITSPGASINALDLGRPGDVRHFVHKFIGRTLGKIGSSVLGGIPVVGGLASGIFDQTLGRALGSTSVPVTSGCPPGFLNTGGGCVPVPRAGGPVVLPPVQLPAGRPLFTGARGPGAFPQPTPAQVDIRTGLGFPVDPAAGVAVMGRFGAGFEPAVIMTDTRRCGRGAVLGVDGLCYNRRDLRNSDRFWPRGRRPLLTGGEVRAISVASSAAKKLERKQKQLMELGLLKRPTRSRRAAPAGHRATLTHDGGSQH